MNQWSQKASRISESVENQASQRISGESVQNPVLLFFVNMHNWDRKQECLKNISRQFRTQKVVNQCESTSFSGCESTWIKNFKNQWTSSCESVEFELFKMWISGIGSAKILITTYSRLMLVSEGVLTFDNATLELPLHSTEQFLIQVIPFCRLLYHSHWRCLLNIQ